MIAYHLEIAGVLACPRPRTRVDGCELGLPSPIQELSGDAGSPLAKMIILRHDERAEP